MRIKPSNMGIYVTLSYYQTNHLTTTFLVVVCCYMCNGQDMQCFAIKGNGHPVIDRELYTVALTILVILVCFAEDWCSKHFSTLFRCLILAHQIFLPELYLVHPHIHCPKHHSRVGAMKKHRGLCGSAEWPKLPLHLGVVGR